MKSLFRLALLAGVFFLTSACSKSPTEPTSATTVIYVTEPFGLKFDGPKVYVTRPGKPDSLVAETVMEVRDSSATKNVTGSWLIAGQKTQWGRLLVAPDTVRLPAVHDTVRISMPWSLANADTLYATRMGLSPLREFLPGGWVSQRWEDEWSISLSWWYNPSWVDRRLVVHQQDGGITTIGTGRDLHVFAGSRSRIDGWWDSGFTVRSDK